MSHYFFILKLDGDRVEDPEGTELASDAEARTQALAAAREIMAEELRQGGVLRLDEAIEIADENGAAVEIVSYAESATTPVHM